MTDRTPVTTADALLDALREVKDDFRAVDSAVATSVHVRRERVVAEARLASAARAAIAGVAPVLVPFVAGVGVGTGTGAAVAATTLACVYSTGAAAMGINHYFGSAPGGRAVSAAMERSDAFLFAGVAAELALGELRTALEEARSGLPGSAETLAERTAEAQEAFAHYAITLQRLDENDLTVRFPWAQHDVDLDVARALLEVNAEAVLAQIGMTVPRPDTGAWRRARPRKASTTVPRAGDLGLVIELAETLRQGMATAGDSLARAEEVLRRAARERPDDALGPVADLVAQARMRAGLVEADCLLAETAARQAEAADSAADGLRRIKVAPALPVLGNTFEGYVVSLQIAASQLAAAEGTKSLRDVSLAIRKALDDCSQLAATASALISAIVTAWETIGGLVRS